MENALRKILHIRKVAQNVLHHAVFRAQNLVLVVDDDENILDIVAHDLLHEELLLRARQRLRRREHKNRCFRLPQISIRNFDAPDIQIVRARRVDNVHLIFAERKRIANLRVVNVAKIDVRFLVPQLARKAFQHCYLVRLVFRLRLDEVELFLADFLLAAVFVKQRVLRSL